MLVLLKGFFSSAGLIVAIGAQNAFVIKQGLLRRELLLTALICSCIDAALIILGVLGFGQVINAYPFLLQITKYFAIVFLFAYGVFSLKSAFGNRNLIKEVSDTYTKKKTVFFLLAISLLNPHVYLDTVILLGSIASQHPSHEQIYFAIGAILASFSWFFSLSYGTRFLTPFLQSSLSWKVLDVLIAMTMWIIALSLLNF